MEARLHSPTFASLDRGTGKLANRRIMQGVTAAKAKSHSMSLQTGHIAFGIEVRIRLARRQIDETLIE